VICTRHRDPDVELPVNMTVLTPQMMEESNIKNIADVAALIPGVEFDFFSRVGSGVYTNIIIRGVTDRHGSATGMFLDDVALPAARSNTFGRALPFYFDLDRIEVLRGPQGTLLGADTQGGAVKFYSTPPSLTTFSGQAHAELATTARGDPSYEAGAAAGGPLVPDVLGFRVSAWYRTDGGYVNLVSPFTCQTPNDHCAVLDPSSNNTPSDSRCETPGDHCTVLDANSNKITSESLHAALNFTPDGSLMIIPSMSYESAKARDSPAFFTYLSDPGNGVLNNGSLRPQPFSDSFYLGSVRISMDVGRTALESVSAYYHRAGDLVVDDTESVKWGLPGVGWGNPLGPAYPASYADAVTTYTQLRQTMYSQELRLSPSENDAPLTWLASLFYANTRDTEAYHVVAQSIPRFGGAPLDSYNSTTTVQNQLAALGQATWLISRVTTLSAGVGQARSTIQLLHPASAVPSRRGHASCTFSSPTPWMTTLCVGPGRLRRRCRRRARRTFESAVAYPWTRLELRGGGETGPVGRAGAPRRTASMPSGTTARSQPATACLPRAGRAVSNGFGRGRRN
jgi:outer membrane receptor protein involved in Fe transport